MRDYIIGLGQFVYQKVKNQKGTLKNRLVNGYSPGGDAQFNIDAAAEEAVLDYIQEKGHPVAFYTEDGGLKLIGEDPQYILIVDPIDGTRPAAAGLEMSCISIALASYKPNAKIKDIEFAFLLELKSGAYMYGDIYSDAIHFEGYHGELPNLSGVRDIKNMFWSLEFNGHPAQLMTDAYGHLIDQSANNGGVFVFNSASYSISRIITGQMDAYVDIGNRLLKDDPKLLSDFQQVGNGQVLHLFPYDIAASIFLAKKAGVVITDAYGRSLDETLLTDLSYQNQQSCIAASTKELHQTLLDQIRWGRKEEKYEGVGMDS
ncbi:inositol monophosphatase family protein [Bacillus velezensis]|uniref:inositol monophosphatase family protein n=1 Tax=Bacillus velezensis TaxID=492670 RepID=UPI002DB6BC14|nr:inositol monophosphatase family protein [Bacillus velezensis]MEC2019224.1 inositol monophosphatase family protein [Bacillus velezensis]